MKPPDDNNKASVSDDIITGKSNYRGKTDYSVVYEDNHIAVINKPPGLLTTPIKGIRSLNVQELLLKEKKFKKNAVAAHRIDRYTSGLVVFGLTKTAHRNLGEQFRNRTPERYYLAVVKGVPEQESGTLVHHMKQIKAGFRNVVVDSDDNHAKRAELHYHIISKHVNRSLIQIHLVTGLKNQIRVQFAEIGHPLLGDRHYVSSEAERPEIDRQALHASELKFLHPKTKKPIHCKALLPKDIKKLIGN